MDDGGSETEAVYCDHLIELFCIKLSDGLDHPAIWAAWPDFLKGFPLLPDRLARRLASTGVDDPRYLPLRAGRALCRYYDGEEAPALVELEDLLQDFEASPLLRGALQYLRGRVRSGKGVR